jgi:uncharacterized protein YdhG (YjbR/CyaY superfamily)
MQRTRQAALLAPEWSTIALTHRAFYPGALAVKAHQEELEAYDISKGTIRFRADSPLSVTVVSKMVKTWIAGHVARPPVAADGVTRRR